MLDLDPRALRENNPSFEPKLNFAERCAVLALHRKNVSVRMLAAAFGVNRRTVNHIINPESSRYHSVRARERQIGTEAFIDEYTTEAIIKRVNEAASSPEMTQTNSEYDKQPRAERANVASKHATGSSGINTLKLPHHEYSHRVEVSWLDANTAEDDNGPFEHPAGWYWRDLDGDTPDRWNGDPESQTHLTSAKALQHARATI